MFTKSKKCNYNKINLVTTFKLIKNYGLKSTFPIKRINTVL